MPTICIRRNGQDHYGDYELIGEQPEKTVVLYTPAGMAMERAGARPDTVARFLLHDVVSGEREVFRPRDHHRPVLAV